MTTTLIIITAATLGVAIIATIMIRSLASDLLAIFGILDDLTGTTSRMADLIVDLIRQLEPAAPAPKPRARRTKSGGTIPAEIAATSERNRAPIATPTPVEES